MGDEGTGPGEFDLPHALAVASNGDLYVADRENGRIQWFAANGRYLGNWKYGGRLFSVVFGQQNDLYFTVRAKQAPSDAEGWLVRVDAKTGRVLGRIESPVHLISSSVDGSLFVGTGAGYPAMLGIPGDSLNGVLSANELLTRCNLMRAKEFPTFDTPLPLGSHVTVVGAGNTEMDAMRVCLRLGAKDVHCVYRRSKTECPARAEEVHHAEEEGVEFHWLTNPVEILDDGKGGVRGMRVIRMELGEPDESGRRRPVPVPGSEHEIETDLVVFAIGTNANPIMGQTSKLKLNKWGYIDADTDLATSVAGVYAGGDIVTGAATVIEAMGAGRRAARNMKAYLGLRDADAPYAAEGKGSAGKLFGIDARERNFVRVRIPA
jgi:glutamate synthase (NADPH/NADH) small chain